MSTFWIIKAKTIPIHVQKICHLRAEYTLAFEKLSIEASVDEIEPAVSERTKFDCQQKSWIISLLAYMAQRVSDVTKKHSASMKKPSAK